MSPNNNANKVPAPGKKLEELPLGTILGNGLFKLMELAQSHPLLGLTYNAINQAGEGFIIKMDDEKRLLSFVRSEAGFLQTAMKTNAHEFFVEIVHSAKWMSMIYFVTKFRPGPSLQDCLCSMKEGKFSAGTAIRVAFWILKGLEATHSLSYLMRRIDPNVIKFDVAERKIYFSDLSSTRLDPLKINIKAPVRWAGANLYGPLAHHTGGSIAARHDLESLLYFLVDMTIGKLPWEGTPPDMMGSVKRQSVTDQSLFAECPSQYAAMYTYISCLADADKIDYDKIYKRMEEAWKQQGVKKIDEPYDWEKHMKKIDEE
ncbi:hypothetical protein L596_022034 [Steinernema carpocapsae]|uniref:Protein kinase domain-containing protein n=1 Tax=Steinernema carpocapsae TaxID=34508 RepID=A0A4U5MKM5_STECR|nr:hypothetical protein L596_022034 [Steinernema carpocapsae]